ncbi:transcriptional attenuator, LytR family [Propionispira arboris]|uniref:Transcriptional attenuator, LytR family n=1 Tax=Propionispira arboris TaxID=84035 RepID=A0A1H7CYQ5_9FIRM|nr:LCP family protein [Propionispira arboris]SEJ90985.1 transcriptional attenuator, LytR family [Propionispira arboris]
MKNTQYKKKKMKKIRRIRWGRLFVFIIVLISVVVSLGWGLYSLFFVLKGTYDNYSSLYADYQTRQELKKKAQDPKFAAYTNILLLGIDNDVADEASEPGQRSDTVVVAAISHKDGSIHFLSIPRDTVVSIDGRSREEKIDEAYFYGGAQLAVKTTEKLLQIPIQEYLAIDTKAFAELVDALGGIDLYVETNMDYDDPYADLQIHLAQGYQHLTGDEAQKYLRYRSDELSDIGRMRRQQKFLKEFYAKIVRFDTIWKLPEIVNILKYRVTTSIELLNISQMEAIIKMLFAAKVTTNILPGTMTTVGMINYWLPDQSGIQAQIDAMFKNEINDKDLETSNK